MLNKLHELIGAFAVLYGTKKAPCQLSSIWN